MLVRSSAVSWESGLPKKSNAAERIVHATASLLASRGYFGTGLSDIIARAEAPKGSLYHYFPEGKPQIASAAIGFVAAEVVSFLDRAGTQAPHARNVLRQFTTTLRGWLERSRFEEACPVFSTSLSIDAELAPVHAECRRAPAPGTPASSVRCAPTGWRKSSPPRAPG